MEKDEPKGSIHSADQVVPGAFSDVADAVLSAQQTLTQAVFARRSEYTRPRRLRIKIGSWNVGNHDCARDIGAWFARGRRSSGGSPALDKVSERGSGEGEAPAQRDDKQRPQRKSLDQDSSVLEDEFDMYVLGL